jgi:hypothetical protein
MSSIVEFGKWCEDRAQMLSASGKRAAALEAYLSANEAYILACQCFEAEQVCAAAHGHVDARNELVARACERAIIARVRALPENGILGSAE